MSSLWKLIHKGRGIRYDSGKYSEADADQIFRKVMESQPHLVNISQQAVEYFRDTSRNLDFTDFDATPCFSHLWMEWNLTRRCGALVHRCPATQELDDFIRSTGKKMTPSFPGSKYRVQFLFFTESEGYPDFHGLACFYIDAMGHPLTGYDISAAQEDRDGVMGTAFMLADVLTTMNTAGTRIEPPFEDRHTQIVKPDRPPFSVWHTIHLPKFARPPLVGATVSPEILERREHWVRGHRRDYRNGPGMFGRIKALIWVPEFERGNPELGTVRQTHKVGVGPEKKP